MISWEVILYKTDTAVEKIFRKGFDASKINHTNTTILQKEKVSRVNVCMESMNILFNMEMKKIPEYLAEMIPSWLMDFLSEVHPDVIPQADSYLKLWNLNIFLSILGKQSKGN